MTRVRLWRLSRRALKVLSIHPKLSEFAATVDTSRPTGRYADLFFGHRGRLCHKWYHYFEAYDRAFEQFTLGFTDEDGQHRPLRFLEIGVSQGGSLEIWRKYFGTDAIIYGIDIDPRCAGVAASDVEVRIGSQSDPAFLASVVEEMGGIDAVLDDGSHVAAHQRASLDVLFPLLSYGGVYMVEDVHTSYWFGKGGGYLRPGSFIQVAKGMIDGLHKWYFQAPVGRRPRMALRDIKAISFYDSIVVIEKAKRRRPSVGKVGTRSF